MNRTVIQGNLHSLIEEGRKGPGYGVRSFGARRRLPTWSDRALLSYNYSQSGGQAV
jgi:hypothetical protein